MEGKGYARTICTTDGSVKRETESLIMAAQEQALATNLMKARIYQTQKDGKCPSNV